MKLCFWLGLWICWCLSCSALLEKGTPALSLDASAPGLVGRQEAVAVVAVMTGFDAKYQQRRQHARQTWFPATRREMERLYEETGMVLRFAVGNPPDKYAEAVAAEEQETGPFIHIPVKDVYKTLTFKTVAFWEVVSRSYSAKYIIKVDDDSYVRLDRLSVAIGQWAEANAEYIGCFKVRDNAENRLRLRTHRWYDPHHVLLDGDASCYAEGPFYALAGGIVEGVVRSGLAVRMGGPNEDIMTGWVMKAFNVTHADDRRLCYKRTCDASLIAFQWDHAVRDFQDPEWRTSSLCCQGNACQDPSKRDEDGLACMHKLHTEPACALPTLNANNELPLYSGPHHELTSDNEWIYDF